MTEQEFQDEASILDLACLHIGVKGGLSGLPAHSAIVTALVAKMKRLGSARNEQMAPSSSLDEEPQRGDTDAPRE